MKTGRKLHSLHCYQETLCIPLLLHNTTKTCGVGVATVPDNGIGEHKNDPCCMVKGQQKPLPQEIKNETDKEKNLLTILPDYLEQIHQAGYQGHQVVIEKLLVWPSCNCSNCEGLHARTCSLGL